MARGSYKKNQYEKGKGFPLGACRLNHGRIQFSISLKEEAVCNLHILSAKAQQSTSSREIFLEEESIIGSEEKYCLGDVFSVVIPFDEERDCYYYYEKNGKRIPDPYARQIVGREQFGVQGVKHKICYKVNKRSYATKDSWNCKYHFEELVIYKLHVRGFTMHESSGVKERGTFQGVIEKIPYLKTLGINAIELMPCYEFNEITDCSYASNVNKYPMSSSITHPHFEEEDVWKLNYWGYAEDNYYFAPKASYASKPHDCCHEFKEMIDALHENGIEVYMEFHFGFNTNQCLIADCLHFWQEYYQIDGFRVNQEWIPDKFLATDPLLNQVKLFTDKWDMERCFPDGRFSKRKHLADYNEEFMRTARRFLKGDEEQVRTFARLFKSNPDGKAVVNYLANTNTMTLMDMVSYDVKHNEENGEHNQDGTDYNYSWNCGVEGKTRKKSVLVLRKKQIRNALMLLFFSQGVPLLAAGDEFGNSQMGNNNPYCLDNETTWLNWNDRKKNEWIFEFTKKCIAFRKQHKILHKEEWLKGIDYIACGCPDISFHGLSTWYPDYSNYSRVLGILLCGRYAKINRTQYDKDIYIAINFHWEEHEFSLPKPLNGKHWSVVVNTEHELQEELHDGIGNISEKTYLISPRTIMMFIETS